MVVFTSIEVFAAGSVVTSPRLLLSRVAFAVAALLLLLVPRVFTVAIGPVSLVPHRRPSLGESVPVAAAPILARAPSVPAPVPAPAPAAVVPLPSPPRRRTRAPSTAASTAGPVGAVPARRTIEPDLGRGGEGELARSRDSAGFWVRTGGSPGAPIRRGSRSGATPSLIPVAHGADAHAEAARRALYTVRPSGATQGLFPSAKGLPGSHTGPNLLSRVGCGTSVVTGQVGFVIDPSREE